MDVGEALQEDIRLDLKLEFHIGFSKLTEVEKGRNQTKDKRL